MSSDICERSANKVENNQVWECVCHQMLMLMMMIFKCQLIKMSTGFIKRCVSVPFERHDTSRIVGRLFSNCWHVILSWYERSHIHSSRSYAKHLSNLRNHNLPIKGKPLRWSNCLGDNFCHFRRIDG